MDFLSDVMNLVTVPVAVVIMFITWAISQNVKRDEQDRLPNWFTAVPFAIGFLSGIPSYLIANAVLVATQAWWLTVLLCVQRGMVYGATAIGLWSARSLVPYFAEIFPSAK